LDDVDQKGKTFIRKSFNLGTGKETKANEFNQAKWVTATNGYLDSIKSNMDAGKFDWASFVEAASKFKKRSRNGESVVASSSSTPAASKDIRALIVEDSDDSDGDSSNNSGHGPGRHNDTQAQAVE
jgi:hypothetical protein